jgi:hypothetical protein
VQNCRILTGACSLVAMVSDSGIRTIPRTLQAPGPGRWLTNFLFIFFCIIFFCIIVELEIIEVLEEMLRRIN